MHWYDSTGKPCHFMVGANGNERGTTLRDARKLNLFPSVTTILGTIDKPALVNWKMKQVLLASLTLPTIENEPPDDFAKRIMRDAFADSTDARDRGSLIHDCLESVANLEDLYKYPSDIKDIAVSACVEVAEYCKTDRFTAEATVTGNGYAGMIDLHNDEICLDWKTKDIKNLTTKMAYDEQAMQLAAYDKALGGKQRRCINVFVDRTEPGRVVIHEWEPEDIELAWQKFELLVKYWQLDKGYVPSAA